MRFFNIDLHIGVIGDVKQIFLRLGHEVTDWTLSAHAWALGRKRDPVKIINEKNWRSIDQHMCEEFYRHYKDELSQYDAFIVTHTPCLSMLYERWEKPIIVIASTRYEYPFTLDANKWNYFNNFLRRGIDGKVIIPIANNKYDSKYTEYFTGRPWPVIASLCEYTGAQYKPEPDFDFLYWSNYKGREFSRLAFDKDLLRPTRFQKIVNKIPFAKKYHGFEWSALAKYKGVIHIPYNVSVMSIFEQYAANIPLFFPDLDLLKLLYSHYRELGVLSQLSFLQVLQQPAGSPIPAASDDPKAYDDPNAYDNVENMFKWVPLADFYDLENMPYISYFSSPDDLRHQLTNTDLHKVSLSMAAANVIRRQHIEAKWSHLLANLVI